MVQQGGDWGNHSPPCPLLAVPNVTAHPSTSSVPVTVLLYNGLLQCVFNVPMLDICNNVEHKWDIKFNPLKSQLMAFSMSNPDRCNIMLNGNQISWVSKVRYLGLYFLCNSGMLDMTEALRKFYGSFNNIISVVTVTETGTETAVSTRNRTEPKPRFFAA